MTILAVVITATLAVLANGSIPEDSHMVWPKANVNVSDSFLPAVVQVLTYLMEDVYDLAPPPESSEETESTSSSSASSEQTETTAETPSETYETTTEGPSSVSDSTSKDPSQYLLSTSSNLVWTTTSDPDTSSSTTELSSTFSTGSPDSSTTVTYTNFSDSSETSTQTVTVEEVQESSSTTEVPSVKPSLAYVLLGRLRDVLANESKRQGFSKVQGFSPDLLDALVKSSYGTSVSQLRTLLCAMVANKDIKRKDSITHSKTVLDYLNQPSSFLVKTLENVSPLTYSMRK